LVWCICLQLLVGNPFLQVNDTVLLDIETGKIKEFIKFDVGNLAMATGGHNNGRVGTIVHKVSSCLWKSSAKTVQLKYAFSRGCSLLLMNLQAETSFLGDHSCTIVTCLLRVLCLKQ